MRPDVCRAGHHLRLRRRRGGLFGPGDQDKALDLRCRLASTGSGERYREGALNGPLQFTFTMTVRR